MANPNPPNQFKKGKAPKSPGRPKGTKGVGGKAIEDLRMYMRDFSQKASDAIVAILQDEEAPPAARLKAAEMILDRGWGKAAPDVTVNVLNVVDRMNADQLRGNIENAIAEIAALEDRLDSAGALQAPIIEGTVRDESD